MKRHHYELNVGGTTRRFHDFAQANAAAAEAIDAARSDGRSVVEDGYWRWTLAGGSGGSETVALDDAGLVPCEADCG